MAGIGESLQTVIAIIGPIVRRIRQAKTLMLTRSSGIGVARFKLSDLPSLDFWVTG